MIEIIERKILGKFAADHLCEDGIFVSDDYIAVIDGATSKGQIDWDGHTSGFFAKETLMAECRRLPAHCGAQEAFRNLNDSLKAASQPYVEILKRNHFERLMASVILYSQYHRQIWSFGDCQCLVNDVLYKGEKKIDELLAEVRSFCLQAEMASGKSAAELMVKDTGREMILPFLKMQSQFANKEGEYRFPVLDGFEINLEDLHVIDVEQGDEIVLASDGYPFLMKSLRQSEVSLKMLRGKDPLCMNIFKSTKGFKIDQASFDDRAYIRFIAG